MEATLTTKEALLHAARELFAEHGFDGASIRTISEQAGANVAAIHYHFGSKEKLYAEVIRSSCQKLAHAPVARFLAEHEGPVTLDDVRETVRRSVRAFFEELTTNPTFAARRRLILRLLFESNPSSLDAQADEVFRADVDDWIQLARRARPDLSERDATFWAYAYMGQGILYFVAHDYVLRHLGTAEFDEAFIAAAAEFISNLLTTTLASLDPR